jgi:toxic protein SymE
MGGNPYGPLTTTSSTEELTMADANLKPRPSRTPRDASACVTLRDAPNYGSAQQALPPAPFIPWMQIADVWLKHAGFTPGQRMRIAFDYRNQCLTIAPDLG